MRILITSGLTAADVGGPAQYGQNLKNEFQAMGHAVKLISYGPVERLLPVGFRHLWFFFRILLAVLMVDHILALDAASVGIPSVFAAKIFRKKIIVRVGGDFLWESYVAITGEVLTLPEFYRNMPALDFKGRIVFFLVRVLTRRADVLAFNTEWQKNIWELHYKMGRSAVIRNFIPPKNDAGIPKEKNFLWAGRNISIKNLGMLEKAAKNIKIKHPEFNLEIVKNVPRGELMDRIRDAYVLVLPSLSDVCPNFIIEGISFNKPFVMTKETGLDELYPEGGIFFDPLDENGIERALEAMLDFRIYNDSVEALKRNRIEHSWKNIAEELIELWKQS